MTKIQKLLALAGEFPNRKRVDYESDEGRLFCNAVLHAVRDAAPEIQALVTSRSLAREGAHTPSNDVSPSPETAHNTRTPAVSPNTGGTAEEFGRTAGNDDTAASSTATAGVEPTASSQPAPASLAPSTRKRTRAARAVPRPPQSSTP